MMNKSNFVHLHLHTCYSFLDGAIHLDRLFKKLINDGQTAVAITDHGGMFGVIDFYKKAKKYNIKPIIGCEVYLAPDKLTNRTYNKDEDKSYHLILLAKNNEGLKNLQHLVSKGYLEGFYYKPRIDKNLLKEYSNGLICLSACLAGEIPKLITRDHFDEAVNTAKEYEDIFGRGNFYLELQENGLPEQKIVNNNLIEISRITNIPIVATNDSHFLNKEDYSTHHILMCIQMQNTLSSSSNNHMGHTAELYVKTSEEMWTTFKDMPMALHNTLEIAEKCNVTMEFGDLKLPKYNVPTGYDVNSYFEELAYKGLDERLQYIDKSKHQLYYHRLREEIEIIKLKGYAGYYLIVWDFINYAKNNNIPVGPGRGSGAGSLAAYSLKITDIDPIRFNLLFERFLNPERESMPDFDVDFCMNKRDRVIEYVKQKYGKERVGQIVVFSTLKARAALRDVGRVLEIPLKVVDRLAKMIPFTPNMTLQKALEMDPSIKSTIEAAPHGKELLEHTLKLEGLFRQTGVHAGGIVISSEPLEEYVPLCKGANDEILTQYEKDTLESVGLVKFDFLGLKNLTILNKALSLIKEQYNKEIDLLNLPLDDKKTYEILGNGETTGVFQLESLGMRSLLRKLKPTCIEDIIAVLALYRPGPIGSGLLDDFVLRKHGKQQFDYYFPELEEVLKETYGIIVYQEQVMQIAQKIAGYSLGSADLLRRAMGKKKLSEMKKHREIFLYGDEKLNIPGAIKNGYDRGKSEKLYDLMERFAEYGFNKSHSAAYAIIAFQTAYLKAHYPAQYMAALLSCELEKGEKIEFLIEECKRIGIEVLPPEINVSFKDFTVQENKIRFGLTAIKNVGLNAIDNIINNREKDGLYKNIYDFCKRVDLFCCNKKVIESLIKSGAFDSLGKKRKQLLQVLDRAIEEGQNKQKLKKQGMMSIEDLLETITTDKDSESDEFYPETDEMSEGELLRFEKEVLGFYITKHPLMLVSRFIEQFTVSITDIKQMNDNNEVVTAGLIKSIKYHFTKHNEKMAFVSIEDIENNIDVVIFPKLFKDKQALLEEDHIIIVKGKCSISEEKCSIIADEIYNIDDGINRLIKNLTIHIEVDSQLTIIDKLKQLFLSNKGNIPVTFVVKKHDNYVVHLAIDSKYHVKASIPFFEKLSQLVGDKNFCYDNVIIRREDVAGINHSFV
jgi:DNA polymerase-3 subunit alpha